MPVDLDVRIDAGPAAAAKVRRSLERLRPMVDAPVLDDLRLMLSELVTNSYRHASLGPGDRIRVKVSVDGEHIHAEVHDPGHFKPAAVDDIGSGWGLQIVEQLSDRYGIERKDGTLVWFDITNDRPAGRGMMTPWSARN